MYNVLNALNITKEDILGKVTEYEIFCKYLGYSPTVNKLYKSPLRADLNPSFGLFYTRAGNLLFKDFGSGESGNCFKFACLIEGRSIGEVLKTLWADFNGHIIRRTEVPVLQRDYTEIAVNTIPFTPEALNYWAQYGITLETLEKFRVNEVSKFWINSFARGWKTKNNLIFSYSIYDKVKIYKPFDREHRFFTNCSSLEIQGWEQLDYTKDTVFITKSLKDIMLLHELGYTAISPGGEGQGLPAKALKILKENFKYVIVLYDKDKAGVVNARKLVNSNPEFGFMFTPNKHVKDLSDYYKVHGLESTATLLTNKVEYVKSRQLRKRKQDEKS